MRLVTSPSASQLGNKTLYRDIATKKTQNGTQQIAYYSSIDAEIYFGDKYIDEVAQIQFQVQQNVMPLIGYNSYTYDELAIGSRIIAGSFAINFTKAGYLYDVLKSLSDSIVSPGSFVAKVDEKTVQDFDENQKLVLESQNASSLSLNNSLFIQRHSPLWNKTFDLVVSYGDGVATKNKYSTTLTLAGVQITGCQQQLSYEGQPVMEVYTFIANDMYSTPDLSYDAASGMSNNDIVKKRNPLIPSFTNFEYNEDPSGFITFKTEPLNGVSIQKILIELKSLGINEAKEVPVVSGTTSFTYGVSSDLKKLIHDYITPTRREFKIKVYCKYKNESTNSEASVEYNDIVKIKTIIDN